jgi:hypothetical protein
MLALYVFSLIVGGAFLAIAVLGDFLHGDVSDVDVGGMDVDGVDVDFHLEPHTDVDLVHGEVHGGAQVATKILSIRTIVYSLFGFGAVGTALSTVGGGARSPVTLAFAVLGGGLSGALITTVFNYLRRSEAGQQSGEGSFIGLTGRVTLPLGPGATGSIVVEHGARQHVLRALPHAQAMEDTDPSTWKTVVIVEMERGIARVAPVEEDLRLGP